MRRFTQFKSSTLALFLMPTLLVLACTKLDGSSKDGGDVIAKVNDVSIRSEQITSRLRTDGEVRGFDDNVVKSDAFAEKKVLDAIIDEEVVIQQAMKDGLLDRSERLRREVMREYFQYKIETGTEKPSDAEVAAAYEQQKGQLDRIRVRHILVKNQKTAEELLKKLRAQGKKAEFGKTAEQHSEDTETKKNGGDLSYITQETVVPEFYKAAVALKQGEISNVVKTEFGYHIIQLTDDQRGFERHKNSLRIQLAKGKKKQLMEELMKSLRQQAKINIDGKALAKLSQQKK